MKIASLQPRHVGMASKGTPHTPCGFHRNEAWFAHDVELWRIRLNFRSRRLKESVPRNQSDKIQSARSGRLQERQFV